VEYQEWTPQSGERRAPYVGSARAAARYDPDSSGPDSWNEPYRVTGPPQLPPPPPPPPAAPGRAVRPAFTGTSATAAFRQRRDQQAIDASPSPSSALAPRTPDAPVDDPYNLAGVFDDDRDYSAVLWWTAIWYAVPIVLYAIWALGFSGAAIRTRTIHTAAGDAIDVAVAIVLSLVAGGLIRRTTYSWRAITAGFAAAVIGAGVATLALSIF
jgi:hypothetical protein